MICSEKIADDNKKEIKISNFNWTRSTRPDENKTYQARIRYRQALSSCILKDVKETTCTIIFTEAQKAPASGQSLVLYDGEVCLGGGIIL